MKDKILSYIHKHSSNRVWMTCSQDELVLSLVEEIYTQSNKNIRESIGITLTVIRYIGYKYKYKYYRSFCTGNTNDIIKNVQEFQYFIQDHHDEIISLGKKKNIQANSPHRAIPIKSIIDKYCKKGSYNILELGCSYGFLGRMLLNNALSKKRGIQITYYTGVEKNIPSIGWVFSGMDDREIQLISKLNTTSMENINIIECDCLEYLKELSTITNTIIITSFFLYQLDISLREKIVNIIQKATQVGKNNYWINLDYNEGKKKIFGDLNGKTKLEYDDIQYSYSFL